VTFPSILGFQNPEALLLLLILPVWWLWRRRRSEDAIVFSRTGVLARGPRAGRAIARTIFILRNVAIAGIVVALARPRSGARVENISSSGINIVLSLDL
jgi:Ca-activated chloride channel family protein